MEILSILVVVVLIDKFIEYKMLLLWEGGVVLIGFKVFKICVNFYISYSYEQ